MLSISQYLLFCAGALALILMPGPDFFYVLGRGMALGPRAGVASAFGIASGLLCHTLLAASGLTLLLFASDAAFNFVKWMGAAYLIWIGVQTLRAKSSPFALDAKAIEPAFSTRQVWRQGVLTNIFNPKVALTFAAYLPQFIHAKGGAAASLQIAFLGFSLCVLALSWFCILGALAGAFGAFLHKHPRTGKVVNLASGALLTILGVRLAFVSR
ncbi:homoserine/homoserine lactone efflux protein [Abditibacteriota bacterium]|nr:homoserine/homoserine lactone efflux protein [Abditibacteriota bacterium]